MKLSHSYSSLKEYQNCPLKYYEKRIAKSFKEEQTLAAKAGERVHKAFEDYVSQDVALPPELAKWSPIMDRFRQYPVGCELEMVTDDTLTPIIDSPNPWMDSRAWFRAKLDLVVFPTDNYAVYIDYKNGAKPRPDFDQLAIGAAMVFKFYPTIQTVTTMLLWTQHPERTEDVKTFHCSEANDLWTKPIAVIRDIHTSLEHNNWPARPSGLCGYCGHQPKCPHAKKTWRR